MAKQEIGDLEQIRQKLEGWLASRIPNVEDFTLGELNFPEFSGESSVTLIMEPIGKKLAAPGMNGLCCAWLRLSVRYLRLMI